MDDVNNNLKNQSMTLEEKIVMTIKRVLGIISYTVMVCAILIHAPMEAEASPMPLQELNIYGDGSVTISVSAAQVGGTAWDFHYAVSAVSRGISYFGVGLGSPTTFEIYPNVIGPTDYPAEPAAANDPVTNNSFLVILSDPLVAGSDPYEFTIHFLDSAIFGDDAGQAVGVADTLGQRASLTVYYDEPVNEDSSHNAIPEPATLFMLGTGIVFLGLKRSRRKRES
jgi:hypothetical protein